MKTIEDMTAQIRKMDATGKSNTMLISKLKKKLGIFYHDITIRPSRIFFYGNILWWYRFPWFFLDRLLKQVKSQHGAQNNVTSNVDEDKKQLHKPPVKTGQVNLYMWWRMYIEMKFSNCNTAILMLNNNSSFRRWGPSCRIWETSKSGRYRKNIRD